jgi:hypothetical protein
MPVFAIRGVTGATGERLDIASDSFPTRLA